MTASNSSPNAAYAWLRVEGRYQHGSRLTLPRAGYPVRSARRVFPPRHGAHIGLYLSAKRRHISSRLVPPGGDQNCPGLSARAGSGDGWRAFHAGVVRVTQPARAWLQRSENRVGNNCQIATPGRRESLDGVAGEMAQLREDDGFSKEVLA